MKKNKPIIVFPVAVCLLVFVGLIMPQIVLNEGISQNRLLPSNEKSLSNQFIEVKPTPPKLDEVTNLQDQTVSEKTFKNSRLFKQKNYRIINRGKKLTDVAAERRGDVFVGTAISEVFLPQNYSIDDYFRNLSCKAHVVVIGSVKGKSAQLTEEGDFIFTENNFLVMDVIKGSLSTITPDKTIDVVRAGGAVSINGKAITAIDYAERPLLKGKKYLLFLTFIPETNSFQTVQSNLEESSFELFDDGRLKQVSGLTYPFSRQGSMGIPEFIERVRTAQCSGRGDE